MESGNTLRPTGPKCIPARMDAEWGPCPLICPPSSHLSSFTFFNPPPQSSPAPTTHPHTPKAPAFQRFSLLRLFSGFSSPPLSLPLPRCAKWKLSKRPEVAIVTCHSNHSPSCVSPSRQLRLGAPVAELRSSMCAQPRPWSNLRPAAQNFRNGSVSRSNALVPSVF